MADLTLVHAKRVLDLGPHAGLDALDLVAARRNGV
jgi:predicted nicotinamide N-methyase